MKATSYLATRRCFNSSGKQLFTTLLSATCASLLAIGGLAHADLIIEEAPAEEQEAAPAEAVAKDGEKPKEKSEPEKDAAVKSRIFLTNGDKLSGMPHGVDGQGNLEFTSESLRQKAGFPIDKVLSLELDTWKYRPRPETIARIQLYPSFGEASGDTLLGALHELTPDSIKLDTWYGGVISLKRSMVKSLQIISNGPGSYYGPNNLNEWTLTHGNGSWNFQNGALHSVSDGGAGRDVGLTEKTHISFDTQWKTSMRFRIQLYSSDVKDSSPDAYYDVNFNRSYAYLRTRGKVANGGNIARGGRWKQLNLPRDQTQAHFDIFVDRKTGTLTIYIDGLRACVLQSQSPDPENLGTGLAFVAEERYPIEISGITVTPWNGTTFPNQKFDLKPGGVPEAPADDTEKKEDEKPPHRIILKNGDEVPGTVGKVQDGRMIIETEYTPIRIPIKRIKSLSLGDDGEQPRKYREDVRAWFHDGGHVTLKLASFEDGKISGTSQAFGDVTFDLKAFSRIDFHIYDKKHNELRNDMR
ncbi:hypothetical protein NT6N_07980 [Oceaniferula spumae]|uniref:3-keto-disaccharide hydrolase domain-containing protein n=1 Tax=Oceaniferula spumae TaxID=2979115 RepID=A0AAT9FIG5_9BACT